MTIRRPVRNLSSSKNIPPRVFDIIIEGNRVDLEVKCGKKKFERIPWDDVIYQVELAKADQSIN